MGAGELIAVGVESERNAMESISRRGLIATGLAFGGAMLFSGCSWTPRNAGQSQGATPDSDVSSVPGSTPKAGEVVGEAAPVDDGLLLVKGGSFTMGSPEDEPWRVGDEVQHDVTVDDFYLSPLEVSEADYGRLMGSGGGSAELPVTGVTWYEAVAYCNALSAEADLEPAYSIDGESVTWNLAVAGYRLPTEAEWEYACRAGATGPFNMGHSPSADEANYYGHYPYEIEGNYFDQGSLETKPGVYRGEPIATGSFEPNAWGLYDMHGNVAEWVWDRYGAYDVGNSGNPTGPEVGELRVNRGGGWNDFAKNMRSAYRASLTATSSSPSVGLRVARSAVLREGTVGGSSSIAANGGKPLVVYFTWSGNTRLIAEEVGKQVGVEPIELLCEHPYSTDYNTCLDEAQRDQNQQARPALATRVDDMAQYGTIYLGYPNWWASIPMPVATFLGSYDFAGKTILPFCSNGGGGLGQSVAAISKLAPAAHVGQGLSIYYSGGADMPRQVEEWIASQGQRG